jgi:molybdopterin-guanine dinucleotide biosynthesis protein A
MGGGDKSLHRLSGQPLLRHPVFDLWPGGLSPALREFLEDGSTYKVCAFIERHETGGVDFPMIELDGKAIDPFFNVNTEEELAAAKHIRAELAS